MHSLLSIIEGYLINLDTNQVGLLMVWVLRHQLKKMHLTKKSSGVIVKLFEEVVIE